MEDETIRIRTADVKDAATVADFSRRTFYESFARYNTEENMRLYLDEQLPREKQMAEVGAPGRVFLLAYLGEDLVGYAALRETPPPAGLKGANAIEIVQLYSDERTIGKGVGPALTQACLDVARQQGRDWIWLGVWEHNHRAQAFYAKWGFERFGEHIFIVGLDAQTDWWMKRPL
jgi:ribosomal protein S18 acetylase RimI-like enzyme